MPFKSDAQRKLCYLLKGKGQAGSWDCDEWSTATGKKKLPEHVKKQEEKKAENLLVGGAGDKKKPSDFPKDVVEHAIKHEMEHTNDRRIAEEIAVDHLTEDVDYYKKLKKVEGDKEAAMRKLARLWSLPARISKLAEVATSPNRGEGDKDEGVVNFDSSEGIAHAVHKEPKKGPALSLTPVDSHPKPYLARKALIGATKKTFGTNPTGGSILNKMAEGQSPSYMQQVYSNFSHPIKTIGEFGKSFHGIMDNVDETARLGDMASRQQAQLANINRNKGNPGTQSFDTVPNRNYNFSSIGQRLDPSIIGAPNNQAAAKPVNPVSQLSSTLKQVGSAMGDRVSGAVRKGAEDWVKSPGLTNPMEVYRRRNQALDTQKQLGKSVGDMAGAFKQTASGARAIGNAIPGMAKQSAGPLDTMRNVGAGASGAGGALYNAFSGATGNQQSYDALKEQANRPGFEQGINDWRQSLSAIGQTAKNKLPDFVAKAERFKTVPGVGQVPLNTLESYAALPRSLAEAGYMKNFLNRPSSGQTLDKARSIIGAIPGANQVATAIGQGATNWGTNKAINYEAGRRTAGYALPVVDWMRANPWAKYMLGAGGLALGGYALNKMFNRGGEEEQGDEGNPVESNMAHGYNQQAYGTQNHTQPTLNRGR